ncbi:MAG: imidazole glycerol phosphate synthase subunit HisH [Phycisphaerae bacterium]|nr:imidazole glycerol phosphate synthase subunit HisH [Phycisphaerae bacterium]
MIAVIDYGIGNLRSVVKGLEHAGGEAQLVASPLDLARAEKLVLPGVAAFGDAMRQLRARGLLKPVRDAISDGVPYLGFCLGLQLLFDVSYENGRHTGMGLLAGKVVRFDFPDDVRRTVRLSVPHMGWNRIRRRRDTPLLDGIDNDAYVYFAHSYHVVPMDDDAIVTTTDYGYEFVSSVQRGNVFATQFHPEKSQAVGLKLLENFVKL